MRPRRRPTRATFAMRAPRVERRLRAHEFEAPKATEDWQADAYAYATAVGEVGYALGLKASTLARCRLEPQVRKEGTVDEWEPTTDARVLRVHRALRPPLGGQAELLRKALRHLEIAGEGYFVGTPLKTLTGEDAGLVWEFLSVLEVNVKDSGGEGRPATIVRNPWGGAKGKQPIEQDAYLARLHRSAADFSARAESPMQGVLAILKQIVLLTQVIDAIAQSRLTANLLYVPWEVSFGPPDEYANPAEDEAFNQSLDEFEVELREHLTAPITDRSAESSLIPLLMRGPALVEGHATKDLIGIIDLARQLDDRFQGLRGEALDRLAAGLDLPPEMMKGKGSLSGLGGGNVAECADESTAILTIHGWKHHHELQVGDLVLTLNHESGLSEWHPVRKVHRYAGRRDMVTIEGDRHSSLTTLNHRWPVITTTRENQTGKDSDPCGVEDCPKPTLALGLCSRHYQAYKRGETHLPTRRGARSYHSSKVTGSVREWTTSEALRTDQSFVVAAPHGELPAEPKWSDAFVELVGWAWTEGCVERGPRNATSRLRIFQSERANPHKVARIRTAVLALFGPESASLNGRANTGRPGGDLAATPRWQYRSRGPRYGDTGEFRLNAAASRVVLAAFSDEQRKVVSLDFVHALTRSQLDLFIDASIAGDGWSHRDGTTTYIAQAVPERLAAIELAAILAGRSTNIYPVSDGGPMVIEGREYTESSPMTMLSISKKPTFTLAKKARGVTSYDGIVWCPTVHNGSWYARRDGKVVVTGNSIDDEFVHKHVIPPGELIAEFLTVAYLRPMLQQFEKMEAVDTDWFRYALDPSQITADPDRSGPATQGHQMGLLSDESWLEINGFDQDDALDPETAFRRKLLELSAGAPTILAPYLLPLVFPDRPEIAEAMKGAVEAMNSAGPKPAETPKPRPGGKWLAATPVPDRVDELLAQLTNGDG